MSLQSIVNVTITKESATVARTGFGTPLIAAYFSTDHFLDRARVYTDLDGIVADGFGPDHWVHRKATAIQAQNPKVDNFVVGRRANPIDRKVRLTPAVSPPPLTDFKVTVNDQTATYTTTATPTVAAITAGIFAAINALMPAAWTATTAYISGQRVKNNGNIYQATAPGTSAASGGPSGTRSAIVDGTVTWKFIGPTVTASDVGPGTSVLVDQDTAGPPFHIEVEKRQLWIMKDETADPGIVTDISAIRTDITGNDSWYAVVTDSHDEATIEALAANIETLRKLYVSTNADDELMTSSTIDLGSDLQASAFAQTSLMRHFDSSQSIDAAWVGALLPFDPGSATWKFKTLEGVTPEILTAAETAFLDGKNVNHYQNIGGVNMASEGVTSSGEFIDVTRTIHALTAAIEEDVFAVLAASLKVPFTDLGIAVIENALRGTLQRFVRQGALSTFLITVPREADVSPADKAARTLRDIFFTAELTGAVHKVIINGKLTV